MTHLQWNIDGCSFRQVGKFWRRLEIGNGKWTGKPTVNFKPQVSLIGHIRIKWKRIYSGQLASLFGFPYLFTSSSSLSLFLSLSVCLSLSLFVSLSLCLSLSLTKITLCVDTMLKSKHYLWRFWPRFLKIYHISSPLLLFIYVLLGLPLPLFVFFFRFLLVHLLLK